MALKPEVIKRRKRTKLPRAPPITLGAKGEPKEADKKLEKLLEQLLAEAKQETLFTMTTEMPRFMSAIAYAGYLFSVNINLENQLAPGGIADTYIPVAPGFVYIPQSFVYWNSLPWWLSIMLWRDSDLPAPPAVFFTRTPDHLDMEFTSIGRIQRFLHYSVTNNHATDIANFCAFHLLGVVTEATWRMIEIVYFEPLIKYVRDKAEELSGRPWP